jgi:hypothetical protein
MRGKKDKKLLAMFYVHQLRRFNRSNAMSGGVTYEGVWQALRYDLIDVARRQPQWRPIALVHMARLLYKLHHTD